MIPIYLYICRHFFYYDVNFSRLKKSQNTFNTVLVEKNELMVTQYETHYHIGAIKIKCSRATFNIRAVKSQMSINGVW